MPLPQSLQTIIHNKPAMIGLAAAGGVGLFVWLRRGKSDNTGPASSAGSTGAAGAAGVPSFDSSATDLAGYLGDFSAGLNTQLTQWLQQAQGTLNPPPESTPSPPVHSGPAITPISGSVSGGRNVQGYFKAWNAHDPSLHLTWQKFLQLNPGVAKNINTWGNSSGADDAFIGNATYRLA
jgi:hypothetical protein